MRPEQDGRCVVAELGRRRSPGLDSTLRAAAERGLAATTRATGDYDRRLALPRLIGLDPRELAEDGPALRRRIVTRLAQALRAERRRGRAGHWTYDLNRHIALLQALQAEQDGRRPAAGR